MYLVHVSLLSHGGGLYTCEVHLNVRERKHIINTWCIFSLNFGFAPKLQEACILILTLNVPHHMVIHILKRGTDPLWVHLSPDVQCGNKVHVVFYLYQTSPETKNLVQSNYQVLFGNLSLFLLYKFPFSPFELQIQ